MKIVVPFSRIFVGILFIISGFIKLNDPLGFSYKLQEYFSPDVLNLPFLEPYALAISVFVVVLEVVLFHPNLEAGTHHLLDVNIELHH